MQSGPRQKILVVEDDGDIQELLQNFLLEAAVTISMRKAAWTFIPFGSLYKTLMFSVF